MDKFGSLNFGHIGRSVSFQQILDWQNVPYDITQQGELRGNGFIASIEKNNYFNPTGKDSGGIINFLANQKNIPLRQAAYEIKQQFLVEKKEEPKRQIPELQLHYHPYLHDSGISEDIAEMYKVGYCKDKSIMAGKICFKLGEHYCGYDPKNGKWLFPKGMQRNTLWNLENCDSDNGIILVAKNPFKALKMIALGYTYSASFLGEPTEVQKAIISKYELVFFG